MLLKILLALSIGIVCYAVFWPHRAPAATVFDDYRTDELSIPGVVAVGVALSDRMASDHAPFLEDVRVRSSPDGSKQAVCGKVRLPGFIGAEFFLTGTGLGLQSPVETDAEVEMIQIGGDGEVDQEIEALCYSAGF